MLSPPHDFYLAPTSLTFYFFVGDLASDIAGPQQVTIPLSALALTSGYIRPAARITATVIPP
ncbi:MAG: DUF3298 domain-containing protein [Terriglobales bacterium]